MALELSNSKWRVALSDGVHRRQTTLVAGDLLQLDEELAKTKAKWGLEAASGRGRGANAVTMLVECIGGK